MKGKSVYKKYPDCFGDLETVFPKGEDNLRTSPDQCLACRYKTACLRSAMKGAGGLKVKEELVDRSYESGGISFLKRWSKKKELFRRLKEKKIIQTKGDNMKTIKDVNISDKKVFVRVDFNVPLNDHQKIRDDSRIKAALPTLNYALDQNAILIVASHLGRPKGKNVPKMSLSPVGERLGRLLGTKVIMAPDCIGSAVDNLVGKMGKGDVLLLENLRFHPQEQSNDDAFGKLLGKLCDVYVNDAFAVCHRANASVVAITGYAPVCVAGFLLQKEIDYFKKAMADPARPLVAIVGGAKVSSKLNALKNMMDHMDEIIIGGAMANTFLKSTGCDIGASLIEPDLINTASLVIKDAEKKGVKLYLPVDAVVANRFDAEAETRIVPVNNIPSGWMALDIGPATAKLFSEVINDAGTIVWNGPMGAFEMEPFSSGTTALIESVANSSAFSIVGGGDTDAAIHKSGKTDKITYISTGGGAFLALLEGKTLPALAALEKA